MISEKNKKVIKEISSYVIIFAVVLFIKVFVVSPIRVSGDSMYNTLKDGNIMFLNEFVYRFESIKRDDIVVAREGKDLIIKRVIGLPGETIECIDGVIYIDGKKYNDKYAHTETKDFKKILIGDDEYFLLGDNREVSLDSRYFGAFNKKAIKGRTGFIVFPFSDFGSVKEG